MDQNTADVTQATGAAGIDPEDEHADTFSVRARTPSSATRRRI